MNIDDILEMMDELLDNSPGIPFSGKKAAVETEKMRDLINEVRLNLPSEIKNAKNIVSDRKTIIDDAKREAETIVRRAEERAKSIVSNEAVVKAAKEKADEILKQAVVREREMRNALNEYTESVLGQTEKFLAAGITDVRKTRQALKNNLKNGGSGAE